MRTQSTVCFGFAALVVLPLVTSLSAAGPERAPAKAAVPTFAKDVAPILYKNCTTCHRPGEIAPMSLLTYDDVRPYAKAIRDEVGEGHMPPWHADAPAGTFENERRLSDEDRKTLLAWVAGGSPKGSAKDLPAMPEYPEGWTIGKPDAIFEMAETYKVPADGVIEYEYFYIPTNFTEPKWVKAIEVRPGNRSVVHHVLVQYRARPDMQRTTVLKLDPEKSRFPPSTPGLHTSPRRDDGLPSRLLATYAPGTNPQVFRPGTALRLEPGGVIQLQIHYTATGKPETDRTKVGMVFSTETAPREVRPGQFINTTLLLPAGAAGTQVDAEVGFEQDTTIWALFPHTHVRGIKWAYELVLPDGTKKSILSVPRYDFNWQTYYFFKEPLEVPKGSKIISSAWYDNSPGNKDNPNSKIDVKWGDQTWEEMQYTGVLFSPVAPPKPLTDTKPGGGR
jgi:mono/diheme cytochrome c family protein